MWPCATSERIEGAPAAHPFALRYEGARRAGRLGVVRQGAARARPARPAADGVVIQKVSSNVVGHNRHGGPHRSAIDGPGLPQAGAQHALQRVEVVVHPGD